VLITAMATLLRSHLPHPPLVGCFFVQEEVGLEGSRNLDAIELKDVHWACNFDGGYPYRLTIGATGGQKIDITIRGRAAHAGVAPRNGISAIVIAAKAIARLQDEGWLGRIEKEGPCLGTANVGIIHGGDATNVVTPIVNIRAEARSHNLTFNQQISNQIVAAFAQAATETTNIAGEHGTIEANIRTDYEPFRLAETAIPVSICREAMAELGLTPELYISDGGLDANWLVRHGVPTVTLGCGQREIHTSSEYLDLPDYLNACRIALRIAAGERVR
jgi:tripeptide aminopeptidase